MKPRIAISLGDPGGIGPEITLKALARDDVREVLQPVLYGDPGVIDSLSKIIPASLAVTEIQPTEILQDVEPGQIAVVNPYSDDRDFVIGTVSAVNGAMSHAYITAAATAVLAGQCDAMCTAPIAKEALFKAGFHVPGHTELLAEISGGHPVRMMLTGGGLRVVLQTIHVALKDVPGLITAESISESISMITQFASRVGLASPRIAVCGLNPHAGESGHFGTEEIDIIAPAIKAAKAANPCEVFGPLPADTVFHRAIEGDFDFVLAMYHDQGLIPVKTLDFHNGVNVTLGLPLIRTSPDHGTAFNIAGKGIADERSMVAALKYAAGLARGHI